jgi:hypothetical protein
MKMSLPSIAVIGPITVSMMVVTLIILGINSRLLLR